MEFRVLGPLQVLDGGRLLDIPPTGKRATLLAALLVHHDRVVPAERLVAWLWGDEPSEAAAATLRGHVWRLRAALKGRSEGDELLVTRGAGYELRIPTDALDALRFEREAGAGRALLASDPATAAATLREALAQWHGRALEGFEEQPFARGESLRLEELRLGALEDLMDAELAIGREAAVVGDLQSLVASHPTRERLTAQLVRALYHAGRQADALSTYGELRRRLADELGIEPSLELRQLERAVLRQELCREQTRGSTSRVRPPVDRAATTFARASILDAGELPETRYARSGQLHIAYQVTGRGDVDVVVVPGWISHLEWQWDEPLYRTFMERLGSFARVIRFDKRNMGLSDRIGDVVPPLEERMDDIRAVMEAAGSQRATVLGMSEGASLGILFAVTYPERVTALILAGAHARVAVASDYPFGYTPEVWGDIRAAVDQAWGSGVTLPLVYPTGAGDPVVREWWGRFERMAASPGAVVATGDMAYEIDVRQVLPVLGVPTLVLHRCGDVLVDVRHGRYLAEHIPGARYVELDGADHAPWLGDAESVLGEIEEFLTGARHEQEPDRVLATVLFTDIVGSTERAAVLGDHRWRALLDQHDRVVRRELARFRGREVKATGDGFLATFDGPARGIRCAAAIRDGLRPMGVEVRSGLHTGEVEARENDVGGIAVHIGARVAAVAGPSEVVVSSTVKDIVAGAGITFEDRGEYRLKGVPGEWRLFSVTGFQ